MKKMLMTTALVGSLVSGISAANAATSVSGNLAISYWATANDAAAGTGSKSYNGFGTESQINLSGSGDLNNGIKYAAGFSWELDGGEYLGSGLGASIEASGKAATEGTYIEFINGGTTLGVGADRVANLDGTRSNYVGFGYARISGIHSSIAQTSYNDAYNQFGFYGKQNVGVGTVAIVYTPNHGAGNLAADDIGVSTAKTTIDAGTSAFTLGFQGDLGVKGLGVKVGYSSAEKANAADKDTTGQVISIDYQMGATKVGVTRGSTEASTGIENTSTEVGIAQSVSSTTSIGLAYTKADTNRAGYPESEKIWTASVGYNMGPVALTMQYKKATDMNGTSGQDASQLGMYLATKF